MPAINESLILMPVKDMIEYEFCHLELVLDDQLKICDSMRNTSSNWFLVKTLTI